jgi:hypothetical protein
MLYAPSFHREIVINHWVLGYLLIQQIHLNFHCLRKWTVVHEPFWSYLK